MPFYAYILPFYQNGEKIKKLLCTAILWHIGACFGIDKEFIEHEKSTVCMPWQYLSKSNGYVYYEKAGSR